jgi:hypothetical protein
MKLRLAVWLFLMVALTAVQAQQYVVYNLPRNGTMELVNDEKAFLAAIRARYGLTRPGLRSEVIAIEVGMPGRMQNSTWKDCLQIRNFKLGGYVETYLYQASEQINQTPQKFCAFTMEWRQMPWLAALVKADKKADDQKFDDPARRLVMAFAQRLGNVLKGQKGPVEDPVVNAALDLFVAEIKTRGAERMDGESTTPTTFENQVQSMQVKAGQWFGNDTAADLSKRALGLLPASLGN